MADKKSGFRTGEVRFADDFGRTNYKVFQMDDKMIGALKSGERLCFKGVADDQLVVCTGNETYAIQLVETSNAVLLCSQPPAAASSEANNEELASIVEGQVGCTHELKRTAPRLHRIRELLEEEPFAGPEQELASFASWAPQTSAAELIPNQSLYPQSQVAVDGTLELQEDLIGPPASQADNTPNKKRRVEGSLETYLLQPRDGPGYSLTELDELVQASVEEIRGGLKAIGAVLLDPAETTAVALGRGASGSVPHGAQPRYRLLAPQYMRQVLSDILNAMMGEQMHPGALSIASLVAAVDQHPASVVAHVARMHSGARPAGVEASDDVISLDYTAYALTKARELLEEAERSSMAARLKAGAGAGSGQLEYHATVLEFTKAWTKAVDGTWPLPSDHATSAAGLPTSGCWSPVALAIEMLRSRGLVLLDSTATGVAVLRHFPTDRLPHDPKKRFERLFTARARWTLLDITPYIQPLVAVDRKQDDMLVQYSRSTIQPDGSRIFSVRCRTEAP